MASVSRSRSVMTSDELTAQRLQAQWDRENDLLRMHLLEAQRMQAQIEEEQAASMARRAARIERDMEEAIRIAAEWENEDRRAAARERELEEQENFARELLRRDEERAALLEEDLAAAQAAQAQWEQEIQEQEEQARRAAEDEERRATEDEERRAREAMRRRASENGERRASEVGRRRAAAAAARATEAEWKARMEKETAARKESEKKVRLETERLQLQQVEEQAKLVREQQAKEAEKKIQSEARRKEKLRNTGANKASEPAEKEEKAKQADCVSCLETGERANMCVLSCKHAYCGECIAAAFRTAFSSKKRFKCCKLNVPINPASRWLNKTFIASYKMLILEQTTKDPRYCSNKNCAKFIPPVNIHGTIATCQACKVRTCAPCGNAEHSGVCKEDKEGQAVQALADKQGWKSCPRCNFVIDKNEGCLHMTCKCLFEWCWECKREWSKCNSTCKRR
ncbi:hypothetical protein SS1G_00267 [Sclerotinia sclerotiorum 1980 UF-70]|uniref:RBR-type E3 ubiquitin transferase n=2 Tax=Sclerotinia sclerotiorum (strain ATCC 18683 / 1980 / Ss-1) TaxID=665079 RepID=A0A1D9PZC6_SCLS1|nr:hypothetical protein SS1G_00267 [Sclerotinia sclerotiorum 1980 UF-70]APA08078.1 hypothetical protein sscle_03g028480 [Sclerotinia sclerotiorum 1980 UF-70]EDN90867.1 hypothetical protein SS1G_00267 [Sclerotinia sclerotiorum 1980 UF-70]